eukprot:gene7882-12351_t
MGNITLGKASKQQLKEAANLSKKQKLKTNIYKGHILEYAEKNQNKKIVEYVTPEEYEVMKKFEKNPKETQAELDKINEGYKKNLENEANFNEKDSQNFFDKEKSAQMEMMTGKRQFTDSSNRFDSSSYENTGFADADSEFIRGGGEEERDDFFQKNLEKIQDNFEDKFESDMSKPITGKYEPPPKVRKSEYPTNNFVDRYLSPERIPGTYTANELYELFETLRFISPHGVEEKKLVIQEFIKKTEIKPEDLAVILKLNNSFYTVEYKEKKYGFWNLSGMVESKDIV